MKRTSLPVTLAAVLLLVLGLLAGCGDSDSSGAGGASDDSVSSADSSAGSSAGSSDASSADSPDESSADGPPTDATVEEFCGTFLELIEKASQQGSDVSDADAIKLVKEAADSLTAVGTPADIPEDARRAFEKAIELIDSVPDDATQAEMEAIADDLTAEQQQDLQALTAYVTSTCMGPSASAPSEPESQTPSS